MIDLGAGVCFPLGVYTIIAGDGKEYGPVPTDQVRAWIASGRADLTTKAKELGSDDWKALGDFPDFARGADAGREPPPLARDPSDRDRFVVSLIAKAGKLDIGGCYERSWNLLKANFWPLLGATVLVMLIEGVAGSLRTVGIAASLILGGVFTGGLQYFYLKKIRGRPADIGDAFSGFVLAFGPLVIAGLLCAALSAIGMMLLIVPGVYLIVAYQFTYLLVLDKKLDFWSAMEVSRRVITAQWWRIFGLLLLAIPFMLLGFVCLIVGFFVAIVLIQGALVYAYEDLCSPN